MAGNGEGEGEGEVLRYLMTSISLGRILVLEEPEVGRSSFSSFDLAGLYTIDAESEP